MDLKLDHGGIAELLKSGGIASVIQSAAEATAAAARGRPEVVRHEASVTVAAGTTDRAICSVTVAHFLGMGLQGKHGTLTGAAGDAGLEVSER